MKNYKPYPKYKNSDTPWLGEITEPYQHSPQFTPHKSLHQLLPPTPL